MDELLERESKLKKVKQMLGGLSFSEPTPLKLALEFEHAREELSEFHQVKMPKDGRRARRNTICLNPGETLPLFEGFGDARKVEGPSKKLPEGISQPSEGLVPPYPSMGRTRDPTNASNLSSKLNSDTSSRRNSVSSSMFPNVVQEFIPKTESQNVSRRTSMNSEVEAVETQQAPNLQMKTKPTPMKFSTNPTFSVENNSNWSVESHRSQACSPGSRMSTRRKSFSTASRPWEDLLTPVKIGRAHV